MADRVQTLSDPPQIIGGKYLLGKMVGSGSSGSVFLARDRETGDRYAIKIREAKEKEQPVRFIAEAQDMARLRHPRLVPVLDYGNEGRLYWYAMPFFPGGCIRDRVKDGVGVPTLQAIGWTFQVLEGLHIVHKHGLVHRDVKPHNVLLDQADEAVLTDFGLVRHMHGGVPYRTRTDQSMGTPNYRAPEQAVDAANVDQRADIYGVGATLYYLLTARRPGFLYMVTPEDPVMEKVPEALRPYILKCMSYEPGERYPDARSCAVDLSRLVDGIPGAEKGLGAEWMRRFDQQERATWWERFTSWFKW